MRSSFCTGLRSARSRSANLGQEIPHNRYLAMRLLLIVMGHHAIRFPGVVAAQLGLCERLALAAPATSRLAHLFASCLFLFVGDQRHLDAVATHVNPGFSCVRDAILRTPRRLNRPSGQRIRRTRIRPLIVIDARGSSAPMSPSRTLARPGSRWSPYVHYLCERQ